jgi:type I restriction enzyme M protein
MWGFMAEAFVSVKDAASLLGVSTATLRNWDKAGKLSPRRHPVNGYRLYDRREIEALRAQTSLFEAPEPTRSGATPLDARSVRRLIARLHNVLRDSDSQSNIVLRFDEITKLLFAKIMSERQQRIASPFSTSGTVQPSVIRSFYADLAGEYSALIPAEFHHLKCSDTAVVECVNALRMVDFSSASIDVKGIAYEEVIRNTFDKSDHQQFFTPPQIVEFIVSAAEPFVRGAVCDPASGTGGFLASVARRGLPYESLTAFEIDARLAWVSGINLLMHEAHNISATLLPDGGTLGKAANGFFGKFDAILTNPPFGSDFTDREALDCLSLGVGRVGRRRGILFVERCCELLKPQGLLAIIIDEGVLNLPHAEDVRRFILDRFNVQAVVGLPESTFMPYATVNASILLLTKRG